MINFWLRYLSSRWKGIRLSQTPLGKYILLFASTLHFGWALLLLLDPAAAGSTPIDIIVRISGGAYRGAFTLTVVASMATGYLFLKRQVSPSAMALLLVPQQLVLFMSAGSGLFAVITQHYADGVPRPWAFILSDQLPVILASLLYTVAVIESSFRGENYRPEQSPKARKN